MDDITKTMLPMPDVYILDEDGKEVFYDRLFTVDFFHSLTALMRIAPDVTALQELRIGHAQAVSAFMSAKHALANKTTLRQDNKHLELIAYHADKLVELLGGLCGYPAAQQRLASEIITNPSAYTARKGISLSVLMDRDLEHNLFTVQHLLSDLWASATRAQVKPRPDHSRREDFLAKYPELAEKYPELRDIARISRPVLEPTLTPDDIQRTYRKKSEPIIAFIAAFADTWRGMTHQTYGAGMHLRESGGTKSAAVDAVHLSIKLLDSHVKRSQIVTAFRKWADSEGDASQN